MFQSNSYFPRLHRLLMVSSGITVTRDGASAGKLLLLFLDLVGVFKCLAIHIYSGTTVTKEGSTGRKIRFLNS